MSDGLEETLVRQCTAASQLSLMLRRITELTAELPTPQQVYRTRDALESLSGVIQETRREWRDLADSLPDPDSLNKLAELSRSLRTAAEPTQPGGGL